MIVYIFNNKLIRFERYILEPYDIMPYTHRNRLTVKDFSYPSRSSVIWSTSSAMEYWSSIGGVSRPLRGFCRIAEGGHPAQSYHYAGLALDTCDKKHILTRFSGYGYPTLSHGDRSVYVFILQDALYTLGISPAALDGYFGVLTREALITFQRACALPCSGQADPETWRKLAFYASGIGCVNKIPYLL